MTITVSFTLEHYHCLSFQAGHNLQIFQSPPVLQATFQLEFHNYTESGKTIVMSLPDGRKVW